MKVNLFSVWDHKAESYLQPFFTQTIGQAERSFRDAVSDSNHQFCKHAEDYVLFHIAEFDDSTGRIVSFEPRPVMRALDCLRKEKGDE